MRFTRIDLALLPVLLAVAFLIVLASFRVVGFLGLGILGTLAAFVVVRLDLERDGPVGGADTPALYAASMMASCDLGPEGRLAREAERRSAIRPLYWTLVVATGLMIFGYGGFVLFQLPAG